LLDYKTLISPLLELQLDSISLPNMKSVVITTDVFRGSEFDLQSVAENARWLRGLLHNVLSAADFVPMLFVSASDEGRFEVARYRRALNLPKTAYSWAKLVNTKIATEDEPYFDELLGAKLVIGWGLTPALLQLLDRHQISFVDVEVDPIRFSDDLLMRVRTNNPALLEFFASLHVDETSFSTSVAEIRAFVARREAAAMQAGPSMALFAGQCCIDLSTVEAGHIVTPAERLEEIRAVAKNVDTLLVKPHPSENDRRNLAVLLDAIPNARITQSNIYRILSDVNLKQVVALSSSVLDEAAMFGVETSRLMKPDRDRSDLIPRSTSRWYRIPPEEMTHTGFVNAFLGIASIRRDNARWRLNLRRSLNTAWGFEGFFDQVDLSLLIEPHGSRKFKFSYQSARRALRSII
jgi:hypothetical protein